MTINTTGRAEFSRLLSFHRALEQWAGQEVEWFANAAQTVIGTIAFTATDNRWNSVVLRKNKQGRFQACRRMENLFSRAVARGDCLQAMRRPDLCANDFHGRG